MDEVEEVEEAEGEQGEEEQAAEPDATTLAVSMTQHHRLINYK